MHVVLNRASLVLPNGTPIGNLLLVREDFQDRKRSHLCCLCGQPHSGRQLRYAFRFQASRELRKNARDPLPANIAYCACGPCADALEASMAKFQEEWRPVYTIEPESAFFPFEPSLERCGLEVL